MVVHGDEQEIPSSAVDGVAAIAGHAVARALNATKLLVSMCNRPPGCLCSYRCTGSRSSRSESLYRPARASTRLTGAFETPTHLRDARLEHPSLSQFDDGQGLARLNDSRGVCRSRRSIDQGCSASSKVSPQLLPGRGGRHAVFGCGFTGAQPLLSHLFDHLRLASVCESGMLMDVYPVGPLGWIGCLATSSLSNSIRMNTGNNLLKHHKERARGRCSLT